MLSKAKAATSQMISATELSYSAVEGGKFKVAVLGDDGKGEMIVSSISGVRDLAASELHPVPEVS